MNKKVITFAIAALGLCTVSASALTNATVSNDQDNTEQQIDNKMYKPQKFTDFAFEGILLDVNQQAAIDKINQQYEQQLNAPAPRGQQPGQPGQPGQKPGQPGKKHGPKPGQPGLNPDSLQCNCTPDSAAFNPANLQCNCPPDSAAFNPANRPGKCDKSWQRDYAAQVKEVLTPDQYIVFLENIAFNTPQGPNMGQGPQPQQMNKDGQKRHHGNKDGKHRHGQQELKANGTADQN